MAHHYDNLPEPKDLSHHISRVTKARAASRIKEFYKYLLIPGIGQLAAGSSDYPMSVRTMSFTKH